MVVFELSIDGNAPEPRNGEGSSTLEFQGQSPCAAMRAGYADGGSLRLALATSDENAASLNGHGSGGRFAVNEDGGDTVNS